MAAKYEAIVVGAGLSGSWVAKELCDQGINTVMIDRGPNVVHLQDYPTASQFPWDSEHRGRISDKELDVSITNKGLFRCIVFSAPNNALPSNPSISSCIQSGSIPNESIVSCGILPPSTA